MENPVRYLDEKFQDYKVFRGERPTYGQTVTGYGKAIPTDLYVILAERRQRYRRVYCTIYSNIGSLWIKVRGEKFFLRSCENVENEQ